MKLKLFYSMVDFKTSFEDFYAGTSPTYTCKDLNVYSYRTSYDSGHVYVCNCVFRECSSTSQGGAVCFSITGSNIYYLLAEDSSFIDCTTSSNSGGAIYFYTNLGMSVLNRVCAVKCLSKSTGESNGQSLYAYTRASMVYKNYVNLSSICNSKNNNAKSNRALQLQNGNIKITKANITNNECQYYSALYCSPSSNNGCIYYSSFVNNTSGCRGCLMLSGSQEIHLCNIINNDQKTDGDDSSVIYTNANLFIAHTCILENNKGKTVFHEATSSCRITLLNCTTDSDVFSNSRIINNVTIYITNKRVFINGLEHLSTNECHSSYDSVGTLTVAGEIKEGNRNVCLTYIRNSGGSSVAVKAMKYIFLNTLVPANEKSI